MKSLRELRFDNSYARLPAPFHSRQTPTPFTSARIASFNPAAARLLDLDPAQAVQPGFVAALTGEAPLAGADPVAMCYSGHQFGHYVPRLGDGRAILLGEVLTDDGCRWDLHLKGAGPTQYSRSGDGRAVLRSTIREYLCSEAMYSLGIPSSRALCIIASDDEVYRERIETGAMLVRLAPSHVRFGSFEYFYYQNRFDDLKRLADYVIEQHFPALADRPDPYGALLGEIIARTGRLIAQWQAVGFAHGVMNSDNMAVLGFTLDYGPFGFLDTYEPGYICNHSDHHGRYAFDQQPRVGLFNVSCLAQAMLPLLNDDPEAAAEQARALLQDYEPALLEEYSARMAAKLGLRTRDETDRVLTADLLSLMADNRVDYTLLFRRLCEFQAADPERRAAAADLFLDRAAFDRWAARYRERLLREHSDDRERRASMLRVNPKYVLRNYMAQVAIEHAERNGDFTETERLLRLLQSPFDEHPECEHYAGHPPDWAQGIAVSCSS